jgi:hypothetical protein
MHRLLLLPFALLFSVLLALTSHPIAQAQSAGPNPVNVLQHQDAYISSKFLTTGHAKPGDLQRLENVAQASARKGVPEKFALVYSYPYASAAEAAHYIRDSLGFSGVLVLVSPHHLAISSDRLSQDEENSLAQRAWARCLPNQYVQCAAFAGQQAVQVADTGSGGSGSSGGSSGGFWIVILIIVGGIAFFAFRRGRRGSTQTRNELEDLRRAAGNTLSQADTAVEAIESELSGGKKLAADQRAEYDRALGLRDTAKTELERGTTPEMLTQANQDAAEAVLAMQGVMRKSGMNTALTSPLDAPGHRCFYCGRTDRPPYTKQTIQDNRGNSMEVEVCSVDEQRLQQGQKPEVATVNYGGSQVPWYAVPGNPWYYAYGGPTWQYWLPLMLGMEMGSLFGGGWGWGGPAYGGYAGGFGGGFGGGYDTSQGPTADIPSDAAEAGRGGSDSGGGWDFGGGGGGWDSGGGGGWDDSGGGGGWDSGGGGGDGGWS